jgi:hypothetical protein
MFLPVQEADKSIRSWLTSLGASHWDPARRLIISAHCQKKYKRLSFHVSHHAQSSDALLQNNTPNIFLQLQRDA